MAKTLKELRQALADAKAEGAAIIEAADAENRDLTPEEENDFSAVEASIADINAQIAAEERKEERRRALGLIGKPRSPAGANRVDDSDPEKTHGFKGIGEFAMAVRGASVPGGMGDQRLRAEPANFMTGGGSSGEGYMLPPEFRDQIWTLMQEGQPFFQRTDIEPTSAREVEGLADETTPWGSSGVQAKWRAEGSQMDASKFNVAPKKTPVNEVYAFVLASEELMADAPRLNARMTTKAAEALNWKVDEAVHFGTGAGQPKGWFTSNALVEIAKESGQAAGSIAVKNLLKMYARFMRVNGDTPIWLANSELLPELATLTIGDRAVWTPPGGLASAPEGAILGIPVEWSEHAKVPGEKGDISLISPKGYYCARRTAGVEFASSMHLFFDYAIGAFRWTFRIGGQPHLSAPVARKSGSATKSHFVTLAARG